MISRIALTGERSEKQGARERLALAEIYQTTGEYQTCLLAHLSGTTIEKLDRKVKHGEDLSFEEAFCGMCYVLAATNTRFHERCRPILQQNYGGDFSQKRALAVAAAFLNLMATKESLSRLTTEEVAGMVTAAMMDLVITLDADRIIETCGMGGDKGFTGDTGIVRKSINASTLSSLVLAGLGLPAVKHGSYGNTSAVGSTEAIELFGARTSMTSREEVKRIWEEAGYCFFDAHWCKTIHDLSHLLRMETINHVIGPMTPPFSAGTEINKVIGVNEKMHPQTIAEAYALLHQKGVQKIGGVLVICGLDRREIPHSLRDHRSFKGQVILDEVSPYTTVVSATRRNRYLGTVTVRPEDFGANIDPEQIWIVNDRSSIQEANCRAISGMDPALAQYLAMNAALGLFAFEYLDRLDAVNEESLHRGYLRECFTRCHEAIVSGKGKEALARYVRASGGMFHE